VNFYLKFNLEGILQVDPSFEVVELVFKTHGLGYVAKEDYGFKIS